MKIEFVAGLHIDMYVTQFHPEKSGEIRKINKRIS